MFEITSTSNTQLKTAKSEAEANKAVAEIQAAFTVAKRFPRDEQFAVDQILQSCKRQTLAEQAMYAFPRGNATVSGVSIRLAEELARKWGNVRIGIEILSQTAERTEARAYAIDMQTNYSVDTSFVVNHTRNTKKGSYLLTDERDIREMVMNIGSRNLRACILRIIPGDVCEAAVTQCEKTLLSTGVPLAEQIESMSKAFAELSITKEQLEKRLGHNLGATSAQEVVNLKGIYRAIRDGVADKSAFFDTPKPVEKPTDALKAILGGNDESV